MLYLGHFTFHGERPEGEPAAGPTVGWFTMLAEADSPNEAKDKFGSLIESLDDEGFEGFDSVRGVYLEDVTEVETLPSEGVLARWHEYHGLDSFGSVSTTLPRSADGVASYEWGPDVQEDDEYTPKPFYTWGNDDEENA